MLTVHAPADDTQPYVGHACVISNSGVRFHHLGDRLTAEMILQDYVNVKYESQSSVHAFFPPIICLNQRPRGQ